MSPPITSLSTQTSMLSGLLYRPLLAATRANFSTKYLLSSTILHAPRFYSTPTLARQWQLKGPQTTRFSVLKAIGALGLGLGLSVFTRPPIHCEGTRLFLRDKNKSRIPLQGRAQLRQ